MKKLMRLILVLTAVIVTGDAYASGWCPVTSSKGDDSNNGTLRSIIEKYINIGPSSNCYLGTTPPQNDYKMWNLGIYFETNEMGGNVRTIVLTEKLTFNAYTSLVIGNHSYQTFTDSNTELSEITGVNELTDDFLVDIGITYFLMKDETFYGYKQDYLEIEFENDWNTSTNTLYNYGSVLIDATSVDELPFQCGSNDSGEVWLRDMVILTSKYTESKFFADDNQATDCFKSAGNVHVCSAAAPNFDKAAIEKWSDDGADPALWDSKWCGGLKIQPPGPITDFPWADWPVWYPDEDGDGYGNPDEPKRSADQPEGYVDNGEDCDDTNSGVNPGAEEICGDSLDNDCDGLWDCEDDSCAADEICQASEDDCGNGTDDDGDGYTDCDDADCDGSDECMDPVDEEDCSNGTDDDGDGLVDCDDDSCATAGECTPENGTETDCDDDVDNDADGAVDCDDADCDADSACTDESETDCTNGIDDDGDALIDCDDSDCAADAACADSVESDCTNGIDDDSDSLVDCDDSDCGSADACDGTDADGDGFDPSISDCDDTDNDIYPGADEICADGVDNNCDGVMDDTLTCINLDTIDDPNAGYQLEGGSGCGCYIGAANTAANSAQSLLVLLAATPIGLTLGFRRRAEKRENAL